MQSASGASRLGALKRAETYASCAAAAFAARRRRAATAPTAIEEPALLAGHTARAKLQRAIKRALMCVVRPRATPGRHAANQTRT